MKERSKERSFVETFIDRALMEREMGEHFEAEAAQHRMTVKLSVFEHFMLIKMAERLGETKTGLACGLLDSAIRDAWGSLEMGAVDREGLSGWLGEVADRAQRSRQLQDQELTEVQA